MQDLKQPVQQDITLVPRTIKLYTKVQDIKEYIINEVIRYCDYCGTKYNINDIALLNHDRNIYFAALTCSYCHKQQGIIISVLDNSIAKFDLMLNIPIHLIETYKQYGPITAKEAIKLHKRIKQIKTFEDLYK